MSNSSRGFTLIELVMVIIVIGIIAVYAAPRFNLDDYEASGAAGEVVEAIRYTQALAMEHSGMASINADGNDDFYCFQIVGNNYTVAISDSDSNSDGDVADPVTGAATYTQSWGGDIGLGVVPAANANICFTSRGNPVGTNGAELADTVITVSSGNSNAIVTVEQLTGFTYR